MQTIKDNIVKEEINKIVKQLKKRSHNKILNFFENSFILILNKFKGPISNDHKIEYEVLTEEVLREKRREYHRLRTLAKPYMENISLSYQGEPHIVILSDREGYVLDIIGTKEKLCGKDVGLIEGVCLSEESVGANGVGTTLKKGEPILVYGNEHYSTEYRNLACYGVPIKNNHGQILGVLELTTPKNVLNPDRFTLVLLSVSSIETALTQIAVDEVEEQIKNMSSVVATAVHDLKNPLSIIQALTKLGSKKSGSDQAKEYFRRIDKQTKQLTNLLNNVILFSKPEKYLMIQPSEIIENVIEDVRPLAETNNIKINLVNNNKVKVKIREKVFTRAMHNLLINAIDCIRDCGNINIMIKDDMKNIFIKIKDDGPGISKDIRDNLFQPFVSRRDGGTGLGLYMVYQTITKVHKGEIWFDTKENIGTTFYITIPYPDYCLV